MADPLSIGASVLAIVAAAIKSSKFVFQITESIRSGPKEIEEIAQNAQSLHATLCSLHTGLQVENFGANLAQDDSLREMIDNLESPLAQCERILTELVIKLKRYSKTNAKGLDNRIGALSVKWSLFAKNETKDLQVRLEAARANLNTTINSLSG